MVKKSIRLDILIKFLTGIVIGFGLVLLINKIPNNKLKMFPIFSKPKYSYYESKKTTIDPVMVKELIDSEEKDYAIIDIRSKTEYDWSHIKGAVNMPIYEDPNNVYQTQNKLDDVYKKIYKKLAGKKLIIIYSYRPDTDITDKVYNFFKKINYPVRVLSITWYDWRNNFHEWMPGIQTGVFNNSKYIEGKDNNLFQPPAIPMVPIVPLVPVVPIK